MSEWRGCCAVTSSPGSRTLLSGTNATSRTVPRERIILPDASQLCYYTLVRTARLVDGLVVHADRMWENLFEGSYGLVFSQPVLLALVAAGCDRGGAYEIVQRDRAPCRRRSGGRSGRCSKRTRNLSPCSDAERVAAVLDEAFDLERALRHAHRTTDAVRELRR